METKTFLKGVLDGSGHYCVWAFKDDRTIQKFYDSIDALVDASNNLDEEGYNTYFGLATFETPQSRKVTNIKSLSSFFLDLDCGEGKDYPNQKEALVASQVFCKNVGLPKPVMVNSGNGVHVYWALEESIPYDDWYSVALRLKQLCTENNLLADPVVTADGARVLRIPNTHNYKNGNKKQVLFIGNEAITPISFEKFSNLLGGGIKVPSNWSWFKNDAKNIKFLTKKFSNQKIKTFPLFGTLEFIYYEIINRIKWVPFLDYYDFNKQEAIDDLVNEYNFKKYPYKHYESIFTRFYQAYILPKKFSVDKRKLHLSNLIVTKQMKREEALGLMQQPCYPDEKQEKDDIKYFLKKMDWSINNLEDYLERPEISHDKYQSELNQWNFLKKVYLLFKNVIKK